MNLVLKRSNNKFVDFEIAVSGSKSESNRLLVLQQLYSNLTIKNLSNSEDTNVMQKILSTSSDVADVHHAGTVMRFLTAFFATQEGREITIQGSERMHNRPIKILVDALRDLGAEIEYLEKEGYPPLQIKGKTITKKDVKVQGNISSQYISALLLIAPKLTNGLEIELLDKITSIPYINMTLSLLNQLGITTNFTKNIIKVEYQSNIQEQSVVVESDWSSASYWYSIIALSEIGSTITLSTYKKDSLQGDCSLAEIYTHFGVETKYVNNHIKIIKKDFNCKPFTQDLNKTPDIAQTVAVTCFGLGIACALTGLHTLKIKETDRLVALQNELQKLGAEVSITDDSLYLKELSRIISGVEIETYNDHRMAMAFAPLALKIPVTILNADVVCKSYPDFWKDLQSVGFSVSS